MSDVVLIVVKGKRVTLIRQHYRVIEQLVKSASSVTPLKAACRYSLDEGYLLIDYDAKVMVNAQGAFPVDMKGWTVLLA